MPSCGAVTTLPNAPSIKDQFFNSNQETYPHLSPPFSFLSIQTPSRRRTVKPRTPSTRLRSAFKSPKKDGDGVTNRLLLNCSESEIKVREPKTREESEKERTSLRERGRARESEGEREYLLPPAGVRVLRLRLSPFTYLGRQRKQHPHADFDVKNVRNDGKYRKPHIQLRGTSVAKSM